MKKASVLIIGSGIAALKLAKEIRSDINVIIITKSSLKDGNSNLAQGGIAAAVGPTDHPSRHGADTMKAGGFHNNPDVVRTITKEAPKLICGLVNEGCPFDRDEQGEIVLGMEGAHTKKRIVHGGGDATGATLMEHFVANLPDNVTVFENMFAYELIIDSVIGKCTGAKAKDVNGKVVHFFAKYVVVATGGCGQLYTHSSNAHSVTGDGIALAYRAGAELTDMEFIQFHPTLLYIDGQTRGLISEAVRGEGGRLVDDTGRPIMNSVHPLGDLAPRHIVAQTIYHHLRESNPVFLDVSCVGSFSKRFPTVASLCEKNGVNWHDGIPVAPGSHFLMGGIKTDLIGRTNVSGLYAIGEAASTGFHGANRLASNSLLEGLFMGKSLAEWVQANPFKEEAFLNAEPEQKFVRPPEGLPKKQDIQRSMMDNVGIARTERGLQKHIYWLENARIRQWLAANLDDLKTEEIERVFMGITAWLVADSALKRTESRGGHFRLDFPCENNHVWTGKRIIQCRKRMGQNEQTEASVAT